MDLKELLSHAIAYPTIYAVIPAAWMCYAPMKNQIRIAKHRVVLHCALLFLVCIAGIQILHTVFPSTNGTLLLVPFLGIFFLYYSLSVRSSLEQCLGIFTTVCGLCAMVSFTAFAVDVYWDSGEVDLGESPEFVLMQLGATIALSIVGVWYLRRWMVPLVDNMKNWGAWNTLSAVSLIVFVILSMMASNITDMDVSRKNFHIYLIVFGLVSILYILVIVFFVYVSSSLMQEEDLHERELMFRMQRKQYQDLQSQIEKTRIMRHDIRHTIHMLQMLAEEGDLEQIRSYLEVFEQRIPKRAVTRYCENDFINTILNFYYEKAEGAGVETKFFVNLPQVSQGQAQDLVSVLGNLLDNALQGCETLQEGRRIDLRISVVNEENLYIIISNSFDGRVRRSGQMYLTTRRRRGGKGIGLRSIRSIAEKYSGTAHFYHEGQTFYVDISMKLKKE